MVLTEQTEHVEYRDAIYFTPEEHAKLDEKEIAAQAQKRVADWVAFVAAASTQVAPKPTKAEVEAEVAMIDQQLAQLTAAKLEKTAALATLAAMTADEKTVEKP